jgi:hypothetical protein
VHPESERDERDGAIDHGELERAARGVLEANWRPEGFTVPNRNRYPWLWLWDSCFHSIAWAALGEPERAVAELRSALAAQDGDGFTPHMQYVGAVSPHESLWGRPVTSSITQPPVYGHTVAALGARGVDVPSDVVERAHRGLDFLIGGRPRTEHGLIRVVHPWETGCDDSPRWDHWGAHDSTRWYAEKGRLVGTIERSASGAPLTNVDFDVGSVGFSALTLFALRELGRDDAELARALSGRYASDLGSWVDDGAAAATSGRSRTLDALLPVLVEADADRVHRALSTLTDVGAYGAAFGPTGVHRDDATFAPRTYWRGSAWPQLTYLLWIAAVRSGDAAIASSLAGSLRSGAARSGLAEHWDPDTAMPLGARPQSWSAVAVAVS